MNEELAKEVVQRNLQKLTEKEKVVLIKRFFENETVYRVAKELKISRSTVRYRESKAKAHLKQKILEDIGMSGVMRILGG